MVSVLDSIPNIPRLDLWCGYGAVVGGMIFILFALWPLVVAMLALEWLLLFLQPGEYLIEDVDEFGEVEDFRLWHPGSFSPWIKRNSVISGPYSGSEAAALRADKWRDE